jgi:taurine dioxygenase
MLEIEPLTPHIGAYIRNVDLARCSQSDFEHVYQAFLNHQVIFIDGQNLSPTEHLILAKKFGQLEPVHPFFPNVESHPQVCVIETTKGNRPLESIWHTDLTWREIPSKCSLLHAQHVPNVGGDTIWCSMTAVFDSLDPALQQQLRSLSAVHSLTAFQNIEERDVTLDWQKQVIETSQKHPPVTHPIVQVHPETLKETLFINEQFTRHIENMPSNSSQKLLDQLFAQARRPEFQVRLKWKKGTLAIWDNRVTQHYAVIDYKDTPRKLHRVTVRESMNK